MNLHDFLNCIIDIQSDLLFIMRHCIDAMTIRNIIVNEIRNVCFLDDTKLNKHFRGNVKACKICKLGVL